MLCKLPDRERRPRDPRLCSLGPGSLENQDAGVKLFDFFLAAVGPLNQSEEGTRIRDLAEGAGAVLHRISGAEEMA